jgi:hypothetical protein
MKLAQTFALITVIICASSCSRAPDSAVATTSSFKVGQVWKFHTPTNEPSSATLTIASVDFDSKLGTIIFVSVSGLRPDTLQPYHFMPLAEDALNRSVVALVKTNTPLIGDELQSFQQFYELGRQGVKSGELNKCFKITVAEVLEKESQIK